MPRKKTHAEYVAQVDALNKGITVVGEYAGSRKAIEHLCGKCNKPWFVKPTNVLSGNSDGCPSCSGKDRKTHAEYVAEVDALNKGIKVVGEYVNTKTKITHRCAEGHEWDVKPSHILGSNSGCPHCAKKIVLTHSEYLAEVKALNAGITVVGEYQNAKTKITHRCSEGHEWDVSPSDIKAGYGCPHCDRIASDANVFYIWENTQDPGVYKVGITSERCADKRVKQCARDNKMTANIILMASVDDARDIERRALELGDNVNYPDTIDGYTEFRRYSDAELATVYEMAVQAA